MVVQIQVSCYRYEIMLQFTQNHVLSDLTETSHRPESSFKAAIIHLNLVFDRNVCHIASKQISCKTQDKVNFIEMAGELSFQLNGCIIGQLFKYIIAYCDKVRQLLCYENFVPAPTSSSSRSNTVSGMPLSMNRCSSSLSCEFLVIL